MQNWQLIRIIRSTVRDAQGRGKGVWIAAFFAIVSPLGAQSQEGKQPPPLTTAQKAQKLYEEGVGLERQGKAKQAEAKFLEVVQGCERATEWVARSCLKLGALREVRDDPGSAFFDYQRVVDANFADSTGEPLHTGAWRHACMAAFLAKTALAEAWLAKNPTADPKWIDEVKANIAYRAGRTAFDKNDFESAIREFAQSRKLSPKSRLACESGFWLGYTYQRLNRDAEMVESYRGVLHECPDHTRASSALGYLIGYALNAGNTKQAEQWIDLLRSKYPQSSNGRSIFLTISRLREQAGDLVGAEKALKEGVAFNQDMPDTARAIMERLGDFYRGHGREQEALETWQKSAENWMLTSAPSGLKKVGDYWEEKGDYNRAFAIYQDIVARVSPKANQHRLYYRFSSQHGAGRCLRKPGRFTEAVELYQQAVKDARDDEDRCSAQIGLADTWFDMGEKEKARETYKELLEKYQGVLVSAREHALGRLKEIENNP